MGKFKLKKCKCESEDLSIIEYDDSREIVCNYCGVFGPRESTEKKAIAAWNRPVAAAKGGPNDPR